jgi:hypothetical protein
MGLIPKINLKKSIILLVLAIAIFFLVVHTLNWQNFTIDTTSMMLLVLILVIPFIDVIRKIKYGDFEAEITPKEVEQTLKNADIEELKIKEPLDEIGEEILNLVRSDPQLGLAKLRIEIEKTLKLLWSLKNNKTQRAHVLTIPRLINELLRLEAIPSKTASALKDILPLVNRAVHGEDIEQDDAIRIADTGVSILSSLKEIYMDLAFQPLEKTIIPVRDLEEHEQAKYRVTTVIPYVDNPEKRVYIWDRKNLDEFLFDSAEYAEYPISIEKIEE